MTGRELIVYILQNNLEDRDIFMNGRFLDFITIKEAAAKFEVGEATVKVWIKMDMIPYIQIGEEIFIPKDAKDPSHTNGLTVSNLVSVISKL